MARFTQDVVLNKPDDFVAFMMNDYLAKNGFSMSDWKGEPCYRAGDAAVEGFKYLKWSYSNGVFHLEAWLKGTFGGEWNLDGFVGCLMKRPYKESLMNQIALLQQTLPESINAQPQIDPGVAAASSGTPTPITVQTVDNTKAAQMALVFGIISLVLCWSPIFCVVFMALTFAQARMGQGSSKASLAKAGKICSIVAVCITAVLFILNFAATFMQLM